MAIDANSQCLAEVAGLSPRSARTRSAGDRPRTAFVRDVLAKGDAALGRILAGK